MKEAIKSEQKEFTSSDLGSVLSGIIRQAVKDELRAVTSLGMLEESDTTLTVEQVAQFLCVSEDWVYDNAKKLPFAMKLGPKMLRFSLNGLQKYLGSIRGRC